jgi:ParB family transcriptional regulator, chromosome partitioning protein
MNKFKTGLGRGLDALINPEVKEAVDKPLTVQAHDLKRDDGISHDYLAKIPTERITPNPYQPRIEFDSKALEELKISILENGLIQPITVHRIGEGRYELISGERRLRACKEIGFKEIPAYIIKVDSKEAMLALSLIENIQREKLNPIEIANAYKRLMDECNLSQEEIAQKVGKDRSTITNTIRLLKLPKPIQLSLIKDKITNGHARALINLPSESMQLKLLELIVEKNLSVRDVEGLVKKYLNPDKKTKVKIPGELKSSFIMSDFENKLRQIFGTKIICKQNKNGSGEIVIEFYSNDELERLFELFEIIEKNYS